ncbi:hypothetical protein J2847_005847 [Azospirillum agricola]|uniref:hypothetical protein n=1 Tax=Azospirillum agricola TaxID=1720247 RepID=UPI001AE918DA|nr:hypothetical protein [Azospirillum agricola]MBP2232518.1 hypothetical protein [Azospirillum agricola]
MTALATGVVGADIVRLIAGHRFDLSNEKVAQAELESILIKAEIPFEREHRLSARDIVDFLVDGGVAVEMKIRGHQKMAVYQQLARYARHETVREVVLITNMAMGLPEEIEGKPAWYASLGRGWL